MTALVQPHCNLLGPERTRLTVAVSREIEGANNGFGDIAKVYGDYVSASVAGAYGGRGLVNGDMLSGSLVRMAGETIGSYAITQGSLAVSSNYAVSYVGALLTVRPAVQLPSPPAAPTIEAALLASSVTRDNLDWISLPDGATPLPWVSPIATTLGIGTVYSDPRFRRRAGVLRRRRLHGSVLFCGPIDYTWLCVDEG